MDKYVHRQYLNEEEFLETHYETVDAVLPALGGRWKPNFRCDDQTRQHRAILFASGKLMDLTFTSAVLFHNRDGLSSIQLYLHSSSRLVVARIHWLNGETMVEILADTPINEVRPG